MSPTSAHSDDASAILLLCGVFGTDRTAKPLSLSEYNALARALVAAGRRPADWLALDPGEGEGVALAQAAGIEHQRLLHLLGRGVQMGFALEEWERSGIWVLTRADSAYPQRFRAHLKDQAPAVIYGVGDRALLEQGGLAIVGSRSVGPAESAFTAQVAGRCAKDGIQVVSGGARGVDTAAMEACLQAGGKVVGVLAENLLRKSVQAGMRQAIAAGSLVLISAVHPKARFTAWNAMGRNKFIYALADHALVVQSDKGKGGTWGGATEELKRAAPRPVFVRAEEPVPAGNQALLEMGARPWEDPSPSQRTQDVMQANAASPSPSQMPATQPQAAQSKPNQQPPKQFDLYKD